MIEALMVITATILVFGAGYLLGKELGKEYGREEELRTYHNGSLRCEDDYLELGEEVQERLPRCSTKAEETEAIQVVEKQKQQAGKRVKKGDGI